MNCVESLYTFIVVSLFRRCFSMKVAYVLSAWSQKTPRRTSLLPRGASTLNARPSQFNLAGAAVVTVWF